MPTRLITLLIFLISSKVLAGYQISSSSYDKQEDTTLTKTVLPDTLSQAIADISLRPPEISKTLLPDILTRIITETALREIISDNSFLIDTVRVDTTTVKKEKINYWKKTNAVGLNLNEVAFVNWNSGGNNSFSALMHGEFGRRYKKKLLNWESNLSIKYGMNAQQGREVRKSEDQLQINSNLGYRKDSVSNWYYSAKLNFNTQLTYGYRYPSTDDPISKFMAPGYAFIGAGTEFSHPTEDFTAYISPITEKSTFVLDQDLANEGKFGVTPAVKDEEGNIIQKGEKIRTEFGFLFSSSFRKEISDNVKLNNQLKLYSDYLNKFGNVDIDWEVNVDMKVNSYVRANIGSHLKYDDDVKFKEDRNGDGQLEDVGPKIQFKQILGVGMVYEF